MSVVASELHRFSDLETAPFNAKLYSAMKFGHSGVADSFGRMMAAKFASHRAGTLHSKQCVVIPAPSTMVPVAATLISRAFTNELNAIVDVLTRGQMTVEWTMIHRDMTYDNNYADLPKEQRKVLLAGDALHLNKDYVRGKHLIFVDDIRITGSHEEKITDFMSAEGLGNTYEFVTFATYTGDDASIEHRLNHSFIRNAADVVRMANTIGREHVVTTRAIRILLKSDTFDSDIAPANPRFIVESHEAAMVKGYNRVPELRENYEKLRSTRMAISGSSIERMLGEMHCGMALV